MKERIQKLLASAGVASRRNVEQMVLDGRVAVNGKAVRELPVLIDPQTDHVEVDGERVRLRDRVAGRRHYIILNKPKGVYSTNVAQGEQTRAIDLLGGHVSARVYPVGQLDADAKGLLLLTNDGELAARLTHPRHGIARVYEARVLGEPDAHDIGRLSKGVTIEGRRTEHAEVVPLGPSRLRITVREGRNRQVRKMCDAIGHPKHSLTCFNNFQS